MFFFLNRTMLVTTLMLIYTILSLFLQNFRSTICASLESLESFCIVRYVC